MRPWEIAIAAPISIIAAGMVTNINHGLAEPTATPTPTPIVMCGLLRSPAWGAKTGYIVFDDAHAQKRQKQQAYAENSFLCTGTARTLMQDTETFSLWTSLETS
jgi:hypothetical protein